MIRFSTVWTICVFSAGTISIVIVPMLSDFVAVSTGGVAGTSATGVAGARKDAGFSFAFGNGDEGLSTSLDFNHNISFTGLLSSFFLVGKSVCLSGCDSFANWLV